MTSKLDLSVPTPDPAKQQLCEQFARDKSRPKFLFGRNQYANRIVEQVEIDGFIDDYAHMTEHLGKPIVKIDDVPKDALVAVLSGGRPLTALERVRRIGLECIDYFSLVKHSGLELDEARFLEGFDEEFQNHADRHAWIYSRLADETSRAQFTKLLRFKRSYDLTCLEGFASREDKQYFEDFLGLSPKGETFVDVGAYDGYTSEAFIRLCPDYRAVHIFEPSERNLGLVRERLGTHRDVHLHAVGLSNHARTLNFTEAGSSSRISENGGESISVGRLDDLLHDEVSFVKLDIEGAELEALEGARATIEAQRPRLAVGVYHRPGDIWRIPSLVLDCYGGYRIQLRHYTESIYETVMFFIPPQEGRPAV